MGKKQTRFIEKELLLFGFIEDNFGYHYETQLETDVTYVISVEKDLATYKEYVNGADLTKVGEEILTSLQKARRKRILQKFKDECKNPSRMIVPGQKQAEEKELETKRRLFEASAQQMESDKEFRDLKVSSKDNFGSVLDYELRAEHERRKEEVEELENKRNSDYYYAHPAGETAQVGSYVSITVTKNETGETRDCIVEIIAESVNERIPGIQYASEDSPLGNALLGSREGDDVKYYVESKGKVSVLTAHVHKIVQPEENEYEAEMDVEKVLKKVGRR